MRDDQHFSVDMREKFALLRSETSQENAELRSEIALLRSENHAENASLRQELRNKDASIQSLRQEHQLRNKDAVSSSLTQNSRVLSSTMDEERPFCNEPSTYPNHEKTKLSVTRLAVNRFSKHIELTETVICDTTRESAEEETDLETRGAIGSIPLLPIDMFSFFVFAEFRSTISAATAMMAILQGISFSFIMADVFHGGTPSNVLGVPPNLSPFTHTIQVVALLVSVICQDDMLQSLNALYYGYDEASLLNASILRQHARFRWYFSVLLRFSLGFLSLLVTFLVIMTSETSSEVLLSFAEVNFISSLDDIGFLLAKWGYFGENGKKCATLVLQAVHASGDKTNNEDKTDEWKENEARKKGNENSKTRRTIFFPSIVLLITFLGLAGGWAYIFYCQKTGQFLCDTIYVQFSDDFSPEISTFSGLYDKTPRAVNRGRVQYIENRGNNFDGSSKLAYCAADETWTLSFGESPKDETDPCDWKTRSSPVDSALPDSYDILTTAMSTWFGKNKVGSVVPIQRFLMQCYDCTGDAEFCGGDDRGSCVNNRCECKDGWYGRRCEFPTPCDILEVDTRFPPFQGTREWSAQYNILTFSSGAPLTLYDRPVYVSEGESFDMIFYMGRRWAILMSESNAFLVRETLPEVLSTDFHAYWSNYAVGFLSDPVDVDTPDDAATPVGLRWIQAKTKQNGASTNNAISVQSTDQNRPSAAILLCSTCSNTTNRCLFDGLCNDDGSCTCLTGSSGALCQIPPVGNGLCDVFFNTPEFTHDGGDCCEDTCISSAEHSCGQGIIGSTGGVDAFGFVGFPQCNDPKFTSKISGSKTLFDIIDRGYVKCGTIILLGFAKQTESGNSGFEVDFCKAIAGAVLEDADAIEIVEITGATRFTDLAGGAFDVLISLTTHTAERDIYQSDAKTGFSFVASPYFFDGLHFAGIPPFVGCADTLDYTSTECVDLKICVGEFTTWYIIIQSLFPDSVIVTVPNIEDEPRFLEGGVCNVIAGESVHLMLETVRSLGFTGPSYEIGTTIHSKEPLAAATRKDDRVWTKFVSWVFEALIQAEESNITMETADMLAITDAFGENFRNMFRNAVRANGNYGEIYEKNLETYIPRSRLNAINDGSTGLIYSFPFGSIDTQGPDPLVGGTIQRILTRGVLNCGVRVAPGFATQDTAQSTWSGFEVDICRGISAALFNGAINVNFLPTDSLTHFSKLAQGTVDVMASGVTHTLTREIKEASTGKGFDFTSAYFYDGLGFSGPSPYGTCADRLIFDNTTFSLGCPDTRICVLDSTTWLEAMRGPLNVPEANIVVTETKAAAFELLNSGGCNVIAGESTDIADSTARKNGYPADAGYSVGTNRHTKEPLAVVSRSDDVQFSDFLRWAIFCLFYAAENNITQETFFRMPATVSLFGNSLSGMMQNLIKAIGNYDELFARNLEGVVERKGRNLLNLESGPQLYANVGIDTV